MPVAWLQAIVLFTVATMVALNLLLAYQFNTKLSIQPKDVMSKIDERLEVTPKMVMERLDQIERAHMRFVLEHREKAKEIEAERGQ